MSIAITSESTLLDRIIACISASQNTSTQRWLEFEFSEQN